jgi:hypothetical protein
MPNDITKMDLDEIAVATLRVITYLTENKFISKDIPEDCIGDETECPFCKETLKYWQTTCGGRRGFSCGCIAGSTYQE